MERRDQLLDVLDLEESLLVLVVGPPRIGAPALWRLAVAEVQHIGLFRGASSSQSEHVNPPCAHGVTAPPGVTCHYAISAIRAPPGIPCLGEQAGNAADRARGRAG